MRTWDDIEKAARSGDTFFYATWKLAESGVVSREAALIGLALALKDARDEQMQESIRHLERCKGTIAI